MGSELVRRISIVGATLLLGGLGVAGDHRILSGAPSLPMAGDRAAPADATFFKPQPRAEIPILNRVHWREVGPGGVGLEIQADAVRRRPRRVGLLTFQSFHELVAVDVRVRVPGNPSASNPTHRRGRTPDTFERIKESLGTLQAMVRDSSPADSDPAQLLTRTFLTGVIFEEFALEMGEGSRGGRLSSRTLTPVPAGPGWVLREVQVEAADGRRLTIAAAEWAGPGRLVARGPYTLEQGPVRQTGSRGCFLIQVSGSLRFRELTSANDRDTPCALARSAGIGSPQIQTTAIIPPGGGGSPAAFQAAVPLEPMLRFLPLVPLPARGGRKTDRLKQWLLPSLTPGLLPGTLPGSREGDHHQGLTGPWSGPLSLSSVERSGAHLAPEMSPSK